MTDQEELDFMRSLTMRLAHIAPDLWVEDPGVFRVKSVGIHHVDVMPFMYTAAIILTPVRGSIGYVDRWCYHTLQEAIAAAQEWSGSWPLSEPTGWHRHPATGRRRKGGDPNQEEIQM